METKFKFIRTMFTIVALFLFSYSFGQSLVYPPNISSSDDDIVGGVFIFDGFIWDQVPTYDNGVLTWGFEGPCDDYNILISNIKVKLPWSGVNYKVRFRYTIYEQSFLSPSPVIILTGQNATPSIFSTGWQDQANILTVSNRNQDLNDGIGYFPVKPFYRYLVHIQMQRTRLGVWDPLSLQGYFAESFNVGPCGYNNCQINYYLNNSNTFPQNQQLGTYTPLYEASNEITCDLELSANEELYLDAGDRVQLLPGFKAEYGSNFEAYIDGCTSIFNQSKIQSEIETKDERNVKEVLEVNLFPNPVVYDNVTVSFENISTISVSIYSISGKTIYHKDDIRSGEKLSIKDLEKGIYIIEFMDENLVQREKLIVK